MPTTRQPPDEDRANAAADLGARRLTAIVVAITALLAASAVAVGTARGRDTHAGSPTGTVRAFLIDTAVDQDGVDGCRYLTVDDAVPATEDLT